MKNTVFVLVLFLISVGNITLLPDYSEKNALKVSVMDVGQGQGVLVSYHNQFMLIDTGAEETIVDTLGKLMPFFIKSFTFVVITHSHLDHYGSYFLIEKRYTVGKLILSRLVGTNRMYAQFFKDNIHPPFCIPEKTIITIDDVTITLIQLPPPYSNRNNSSIVTYIQYYNTTFLITGDLEKDREMALEPYIDDVPIDYYVVGHHGSDTSSSKAFLDYIKPQNAIISVGKENPFGHPKESTLQNLEQFSKNIYRTDHLGTITISCKKTTCIVTY